MNIEEIKENALVLHEAGHFYMSICFNNLPDFVFFTNSFGAVYSRKRPASSEAGKIERFYTTAGGMIAEAAFFSAYEQNRASDDISELIGAFRGFDKPEVFRMAASIDKNDIFLIYQYILNKRRSGRKIIWGSDIVLRSGTKSSASIKFKAIIRKIFRGETGKSRRFRAIEEVVSDTNDSAEIIRYFRQA